MFLSIAIGDAFGAGYEFMKGGRKAVKNSFNFKGYRLHPNEEMYSYKSGMYTDDAQMSIGIGELLLSEKEFNHENLADSFVKCYKRDPIEGYARGFQSFMNIVESGKDFMDKIRPNSKRNGAAMRAVPIGLVPEVEKVVDYAFINGELTHNTKEAIASSVGVALSSHYMIYKNGDVSSLFNFIKPHIKNIDRNAYNYIEEIRKLKEENPLVLFGKDYVNTGIPCDGVRTLGAVLYVLNNYSKLPDILKQAILLGGDTDSVASISLGLASIRNDLDDLPEFLIKDLTNHKFGKDYLLDLGESLEKKFLEKRQ